MTRVRARQVVVLALFVLALAPLAALAQPGRAGARGTPRYDKTTESTVTGTVTEVLPHQAWAGGTGTHLMLKTAGGIVDVRVGPTNWLTDRKYTFSTGDQIEVIGSRVRMDDKDVILAREIKRGGITMTLRNANGIPAWSGRRR